MDVDCAVLVTGTAYSKKTGTMSQLVIATGNTVYAQAKAQEYMSNFQTREMPDNSDMRLVKAGQAYGACEINPRTKQQPASQPLTEHHPNRSWLVRRRKQRPQARPPRVHEPRMRGRDRVARDRDQARAVLEWYRHGQPVCKAGRFVAGASGAGDAILIKQSSTAGPPGDFADAEASYRNELLQELPALGLPTAECVGGAAPTAGAGRAAAALLW